MTNLLRSRRHEARAVNSRNLSWAESHMTDVDVLTARGMSSSALGADLERLKYGYDRGVYHACVDQLCAKFKRRNRCCVSTSLVHAALHEYLDDRCTECGGSSMIQIDIDEFSSCADCNGSGLRRYTDAERAHASSVRLSAWSHHERDYLELLNDIENAVGAHRRGMSEALSEGN
ncbi:hypothetical protein [Burkholderia sp. Ac-20353]|uniref:hypothetical protein n=1 Tax=Burkholderia sp. Ac-20353 TaxID=2703894 RepID=UPI00197C11AC|nr:hypothetical protein [Burkholderia sp. Ac-20353]MBN3788305.1 hypothetical protein [Burkholderia sp. Ac-20353]